MSKARALVADDDNVLRYTIRGVLEHAGLEVEEAADGAQALEKLSAERFELVVSDLRMPRLDGMQLLRKIKEQRIETTFVLVTAQGSERVAVEAMKLGAYDYLRSRSRTKS
jgi:two-component system response regulator HydG